MRGIYRDVVDDPEGRRLHDSGWTSNTIVRSAWPLLAGLLRGEPGLGGIRFWAVGTGNPAWDENPVSASPEIAQLHAEVAREKVTADNVIYLDDKGEPSRRPTARLEISLTFSWPAARTLREFALVGGDASAQPNTGSLVNYVIHRRLGLRAGAKLTRKLRLTLDPSSAAGPPTLAAHWLGGEPIEIVDGVGPTYGQALRAVAIETVNDLARCEPAALTIGVPRMKLVEMRMRARLALGAAATLSTVGAELRPLAVEQVLGTTPSKLADQLRVETAPVAVAVEQIGILQLTLDQGFLGSLNVGQLARSP